MNVRRGRRVGIATSVTPPVLHRPHALIARPGPLLDELHDDERLEQHARDGTLVDGRVARGVDTDQPGGEPCVREEDLRGLDLPGIPGSSTKVGGA